MIPERLTFSEQVNKSVVAVPLQIHEETGIDVTNMIQENAQIDCWFQDQYTQLFIIPGIQTDSTLQPKLRKEIRVGTGTLNLLLALFIA